MIPLSVFVVHPDATVAARVARAVAAAGHAPVMLGDGERAIDRFVQEPADVLIVDYFLPGRDGVSTIESIRWAPGGRDAHVVLLAEREPDVPLAQLGQRVAAVATLVGTPTDAAIAGILEALGTGPSARPPPPGESTRVASIGEIDGHLERLALPTGALDRRRIDGPLAPRGVAGAGEDGSGGGAPAGDGDDEGSTVPGEGDDDGAPQWPVIETVMAHASAPIPESGSGVQRRPATPARPAALPPAMPPSELFDPPLATGARERLGDPEAERAASARAAARRAREAVRNADRAAMDEGRDVGEGARAAAEGSQRVMGRFDDTPFAALLRRLADLRASGALVCIAEGTRRDTTTGDPPTKIVYFRAGVPVHVRSNLVDECLGQILLWRRRIGAATLEESIRRMRLGDGLQGEILIDMGALAPLELSEALAEQARDKLFDLFGWTRGTYRLSTKLEPPGSAVGIELALAEIVYEGICAAMSPSRLLEMLSPNLARYVVPDPVQLARFVRVRLVPEVRHVLARIDGRLVLREVLAMGSRPGAVAQLVYAMECLGAVRFADAPPRSRSGELAVPLAETSEAVPEEPTASGSESLDPAPMSGELPALEHASDEDEVEPTEPPPHGEGPLDEGGGRATEPPPGRVRAAARESVAPEDDEADAERPVAREGHRPADMFDDSTAPERERARARGAARNDASGIAATPEHEEQRARPEGPAAEAGGTAAAGREPASAPAAERSGGALDERVGSLFEAERQFRRGNRALDRGKLDEALGAFSRAFELCPDQGEFLAYVGWTRHCIAPDDAGTNAVALGELARARDLAPELHVTHLLHARVLASAGRGEEARGAYLRVLQIDPACAEARAAVGG